MQNRAKNPSTTCLVSGLSSWQKASMVDDELILYATWLIKPKQRPCICDVLEFREILEDAGWRLDAGSCYVKPSKFYVFLCEVEFLRIEHNTISGTYGDIIDGMQETLINCIVPEEGIIDAFRLAG